MIFVHRVELAD